MPVLTNCAIEGYHGKVNRAMMAEHPNLEHFAETIFQVDIGVLKKMQMKKRQGIVCKSRAKKWSNFQAQCVRIYQKMNEIVSRPYIHGLLNQVVIPEAAQQEVMDKYHEGMDDDERLQTVHECAQIWFAEPQT